MKTSSLLDKSNHILFEEVPGKGGNLGLITLNRPEALNALTLKMCRSIDESLAVWASDPQIKAVVIKGEGDKAFCAGGDIRQVYDNGRLKIKKSRKFFWHEYCMNHRIFHFPKPYIALMHGITMGGGVGISVHGTHRVATEDLSFAMPETGIGFFPDVGGSYFLPRCTGKMGYYLALLGSKIHVADAVYIGIVDHVVPRKNHDGLIDALAQLKFSEKPNIQVSDLINDFSVDVDSQRFDESYLLKHRTEINHCFKHDTIEKILFALDSHNSEWTSETIDQLRRKSPTSLKVTLKEIKTGANLTFDECMKMEYRIALHFLKFSDFYEGIRAAIIHKDQTPKWNPSYLEEVTPEEVDQFFQPVKKEINFEN